MLFSIEQILILLFSGAIAGFVAGLFGVGGGLVLVPVLSSFLPNSPYSQHIAIGTSFAVMIFTTFASSYAQYRKKAIYWRAVKLLSPSILIGIVIGASIARYLPNQFLQIIFAIFALIIALKTLINRPIFQPKNNIDFANHKIIHFIVGIMIGVISSWLGIGGGAMIVPYLLFFNLSMHQAVASSATISWTVAVTGASSYAIAGYYLAPKDNSSYLLGFIHLPTMIILASTTLLTAPLGVKVAHLLNQKILKKCFGVFLLIVSFKMFYKIFQ